MKLDEEFLVEVGLAAMPEEQKQDFLDYAQEELEVRIGERISRGVSEDKLREFDAASSAEEARRWLEENRPDYREIVNQTIEELKNEIKANSAKFLA